MCIHIDLPVIQGIIPILRLVSRCTGLLIITLGLGVDQTTAAAMLKIKTTNESTIINDFIIVAIFFYMIVYIIIILYSYGSSIVYKNKLSTVSQCCYMPSFFG